MHNFSIFFNSYRTKPNEDCLYNFYKDGDVCRGNLYFMKRFQWTPLFKKYMYIQWHFHYNSYKKSNLSSFFYFEDCPAWYFGKNCNNKSKHLFMILSLDIIKSSIEPYNSCLSSNLTLSWFFFQECHKCFFLNVYENKTSDLFLFTFVRI